MVDPDAEMNTEGTPPPVFIQRVIADKRPYPRDDWSELTTPVRLPPGRGELEFHYLGMHITLVFFRHLYALSDRFQRLVLGRSPD